MSNSTNGNRTIGAGGSAPGLPLASSVPAGLLFHGWDPTQPNGARDVGFPASLLSQATITAYSPSGIGAVPTTVNNFLNTFLQYPSGQFYQNFGSKVNRMLDRVLIGDATKNNATNVASQPDWLTQYQLAKGRTYGYVQTSQASITNTDASQDSLTTLVVGAQVGSRAHGQVIAITGMGVNNQTGGSGAAAWAGYFEAFRDTGVAGNGGAYGIEIDTMNYVSAVAVTDPYVQSDDQTVSAQLASGGGFPGTLYPTTVGINFQNNNTTFDKGIVFGSNSITGADGTNGSGVAIAFGKGHTIQWYSGAGVNTSSILCNGTTTAASVQQLFSDNQVIWRNASTKSIFVATGVASGVNGLQALGSAAASPVQLQAVGDDTNIDLQITPKGTGLARVVNGIKGTVTNDNAPTNAIGEYAQQTATGVSLTTGTPANVTSVSLAAGDYEVWGTVSFVGGAGCVPTALQCGSNTTSATFGGNGTSSLLQLTFGTASSNILPIPRQRFSLASTTTVFMVGQGTFTGGTMTANTALNWRRIR